MAKNKKKNPDPAKSEGKKSEKKVEEKDTKTKNTASRKAVKEAPAPEKTKPDEKAADAAEEKSAEEAAAEITADGAAEAVAEPQSKIKELKKKVIDALNKVGLIDMFLLRFISAFFLISAANISTIRGKNFEGVHPIQEWKQFVPEVKGVQTILLMLALFIVLTLIYTAFPKRYRISDQCAAILSVLYFDITLLWKANDFYVSFGVMLVSVVFIYYSVGKLKSHKLLNSIPWWICGIVVLIAAAAVTTFVAITTVCNHKCFGTACHDFGLFVQMYHSLINNGTAVTSCERDTFMSHFRIHASYIFYVLVPFFKISPKGETLLIAQAILSMGGIIPMFLIAKKHNFKGLSLIFMGFAYVFCVGIVGPCYYEFHENAFLPTVLMWLLWAVDRKNYIMFYVMSVITCIVKEDAPLYVICIGLFLFFEDKGSLKRINGLIMAVISGAYMMFITDWLTKNGDGAMMMNSRFALLMIDTTKGLTEVVKNSLADPAYLFSLLIREETTKFFLQVMVPLLFIPFFTKKIDRFVLMLPFIVMNLIIGAGYGYAANVGFQYIFGPICLLLYMCVLNIEDMGQNGKQNIPIVLGSAAIILTFGTYSHKWANYENYNRNIEYFTNLDEMFDRIPKDATVGTDTFYVPHLADHEGVYIFDVNDFTEEGYLYTPEKFDFVVIPVYTDMYGPASTCLYNNGYTLWDELDGKCHVFKSPNYNG